MGPAGVAGVAGAAPAAGAGGFGGAGAAGVDPEAGTVTGGSGRKMSTRLPLVEAVRSAPVSFCSGFARVLNERASTGAALPSGAGRAVDQSSTAETPASAVPAGVTVGWVKLARSRGPCWPTVRSLVGAGTLRSGGSGGPRLPGPGA